MPAEPKFHIGVLTIEETDWEIANDKNLGVVFRLRDECEWTALRLFKSIMASAVVREFIDQAQLLAPVDVSRQTGRGWSIGWLNALHV